MQAGRRQSDEHVAHFDAGAGYDLFLVDNAHDEAGEIVFTIRIKARHLRRLATDQGAAVGVASLSDASDHLLSDLWIEAAAGEIIHKEQGRGTLHGNVIDAVVHEVRTDGVVNVEIEGDLELGADTVGARYQHRVFVANQVELEESAESADFTQDLFVEGSLGKILDALFGAVAATDVNSGVGVGDRRFDFLRLRFWQGISVEQGGIPAVEMTSQKAAPQGAGRRWDLWAEA